LLIVPASAAVTDLSVGCWINDPTGYPWRTRRFENKHEDEGGVNWKSLLAGIGNQGVGFAARGHAVVKAKTASACFFDP
jgi:hypothetical protein